MFRMLTVFWFLVLAMRGAAADPMDPTEPPVKSLSWTASFVSSVKIPTVLLEDVPVAGAMDYLLKAFPPEARPEIDLSRIDEKKVQPVKFIGRNVTLLYAISMIAEQLDSDVLLEPGKVVLVPRAIEKQIGIGEPSKKAVKSSKRSN